MMNEHVIVDIWDTVRSYIPSKERAHAAEQVLLLLETNGIDKTVIAELCELCPVFADVYDDMYATDELDDDSADYLDEWE